MADSEFFKLTVCCETCGENARVQVRKETVKTGSYDQPNLIFECPEHGEMKRYLERRAEQEPSWVFSNENRNVLGTGESPQEAIDNSQTERTRPEQKSANSEEDKRKENNRPLPQESAASHESFQTVATQCSSNKNEKENVRNRIQESMEEIVSIEDLPEWFRTQEESFEWLKLLPREKHLITELFDKRYVVITKSGSDENLAAFDLLGIQRKQELVELVHRCIQGKGKKLVLVRDQSCGEFLKPLIQFEAVETPSAFPP